LTSEAPSFPNFAGKHGHDAVFSPQDAVAHFMPSGGADLPQAVIMTYQGLITKEMSELGARRADAVAVLPREWGSFWVVDRPDRQPVGVVNGFGIGAPTAVIVLEALIALGVNKVVNMGTAGCLQPGAGFGDLVVCHGAVRDEGVSHHYLPSTKFAYPAPALTAAFEDGLSERGLAFRTGTTWTIDALFRETVAEARSYQAEGVLTVDMEASALFSVAEFRGAQVASAFVISDHVLPGQEWRQAFTGNEVRDSTIALLGTAIDVLGRQ
jgi:uridine phosphorylase